MRLYIYPFIFLVFFGSLKSFAGEGDRFFTFAGGWLYRNTLVANISFETELKYHNSWEINLEGTTAYKKCNKCSVVCNKSFFDYKTFGVGGVYKYALFRGKNSILRGRGGANIGIDEDRFFASLSIGLEYNYAFRNRMQLFVYQKNDFCFWTRDNFRNGVIVGLRIPLN